MQKQQADFLKQQAIFMQQVLQQMGPTTDKQTSDKQTKQIKNKQTMQFTQIKQIKQTKNKQKTKEAQEEDEERVQLGIVGSGSGSALEVGAWQDESTLFVELEAACDLAITYPNAYSCKDKRYTIDHYTNFLWCREHDQAGAIEDLKQVHAENLPGAAVEARISELMSKLAHISNHRRVRAF